MVGEWHSRRGPRWVPAVLRARRHQAGHRTVEEGRGGSRPDMGRSHLIEVGDKEERRRASEKVGKERMTKEEKTEKSLSKSRTMALTKSSSRSSSGTCSTRGLTCTGMTLPVWTRQRDCWKRRWSCLCSCPTTSLVYGGRGRVSSCLGLQVQAKPCSQRPWQQSAVPPSSMLPLPRLHRSTGVSRSCLSASFSTWLDTTRPPLSSSTRWTLSARLEVKEGSMRRREG
mmetsp:Transcript_20991/g.54218  ORF Transcript_20991/g.54218 Transcript_20991/m.54218 type:complete len:227 (-) Transcript_20991:819-1499(-)